jgi:porphobilinogen deaminase
VTAPSAPRRTLRLGTRGSTLARLQSELVAEALRRAGQDVELVTIVTAGDVRPPDTAWGEGAFVGALEAALATGQVDLAVHSAKDVPIEDVPASPLVIAAYPGREDARDALVLPVDGRHAPADGRRTPADGAPPLAPHAPATRLAPAPEPGSATRLAPWAGSSTSAVPAPGPQPVPAPAAGSFGSSSAAPPLAVLPPAARVGTDSPRRAGFLSAARPDLVIVPLHGNVDTRLRRLDAGEIDALVLAVAGLVRLGRGARVSVAVDPAVLPPAPGQGALAVQCRADDALVLGALAALDDPATRLSVEAEREVLRVAGGGCRAPLGAFAMIEAGRLDLLAGALTAAGRPVFLRRSGPATQWRELAASASGELLRAGFHGEAA